ncbi:MAG: AraC family transcriptional regulator [Paludibacteraceae bacterium]|nr:AraC family transcriptional regulator [Paludibacteraceae bacterium]
MLFQIIHPAEALRPYITRYVFVRAEGSTDTMTPPAGDPRFVNGKHVQPLLPNYGSFIFMRNVLAEFNSASSLTSNSASGLTSNNTNMVQADGLTLLGANLRMIGLTTLSGWFEGMLLDFEPGGMHALAGIDLQQLAGKVVPAVEYGDAGLVQLDLLFKSHARAEDISVLLDAFFLGHLPRKEDYNYTRLRKVIAACDAARGDISASDMASAACLGERQFLRVFRQYIGIPPKQFVRLRRFHRALQQMQQTAAAGKPIDLLAIALEHGYYDLSHMAQEFRLMGCVSPGQFRALGIPLSDDFSVFFA